MKIIIMITKKTVIKHSAIIQITHKITLLEQHLFNALLTEAFDELKTQSIHKVNIDVLKEYVPGINSVNNLKKMLKNLRDTSVEYNIFEKDREKEWGCLSLLAGVRIGKFNKICYFSFAPELIPALSDPRIYSKINLKLQKEYKGGQYGWALYELCWDYKTTISSNPEIGRTPESTITKLKDYFGIAPDRYKQFKNFNRRVLQPAIKEVNKQTDILIKPETQKKGQAIHSIIFHITKNPKFKKFLSLPNIPIEQITLPFQEDSIDTILKDLKITTKVIKDITKQYSDKQIKQALKICADNEEQGSNITYPGPYLKRILASVNNSQSLLEAPEDKETLAKQQALGTAENEAAKELYQSMTEEQKFNHMLETSEALIKVYSKLTTENQEKVRQYAYKEVFTSFSLFKPCYNAIIYDAEELGNKQ